jgi:hypothetical protein
MKETYDVELFHLFSFYVRESLMPIIVVDPSKEIGEPGYQSQYSEKPWAG